MSKIRKLHIVIHGFALLHAVSVAVMAALGYADHVLLTAMTVAMLIVITRIYNYPVDMSAAIILLSCFAGFYLGTEGAKLMDRVFPEMGQLSNVATTFIVTELLGWITYVIVNKERKSGEASDKGV